jgi:autoinducer 2 (AI-2) kinase
LRANIEQIQEVSNTENDVVWMGGGMVKSQTWRGIVSQVLNARVRFGNNSETTALGAVICAGVGAGVFRDLFHGVEELAEISEEQIPKPEAVKTYQTYFQDWKSLKQERKEADLLASNFMIEFLADREHADPSIPETFFKPRIYVSADLDQGSINRLKNFGKVQYASFREEEGLLVGEDLIETIDGYHVFVTEVDLVDADVLKHLPDLRVIISCRGNPVNIDIEACTAAGVVVLNTPGRNAGAVADLTLSFLLMLARKMPEAIAFLHRPGGEAGDMGRMGMAYSQLQGHELWRKTLGLIGAGSVGREVIKRALPFGMRILVHDPFLSQEEILLLGAEGASLDRVLEESDFLSLHAAVTEDTRGMLNHENFAKMKAGAFLINTARAALIEEEALLQALKGGKLGGVALDVFPLEPPGSDDPLLGFPNVIATPHIGGNSHEVAAHQGAIIVDDLECLLQGAQPPHILNPEVMAHFSWTGERVMMTEKLDSLAQGAGPGVSDLEVEAQKSTDRSRSTEDPSVSQPSTQVKRGVLSDREEGDRDVEMTSDLSTSADLEGIREQMRRIIDLFTEGIVKDEAIARFAKGRDVIFRFTIKTLELIFYMDFQDGLVKAGIGEPSREPDVNLKMSADTLDGMFTKRIKAMSAAMTGKLSFSGNTKKAMAFQRAQKDMQRIYQEARQIAGDPGDLSKIDALTKTSSREGSGRVRKEGREVTSISTSRVIKVGDVRDEILQVNNELYAKHYITPSGGNVSARADDRPDEIWITPSQIFKGNLTPEMTLRIDLEGKLVGESELSASSERRVHCAIYRSRPDVNAVIHTHAPQATLLALAGLRFLPLSTEAAMIGDIPVVPFIMPGSDELGDAVAEVLGTGVAVLMQNHGLVVAAESLRRAADITDVIEVTAEKIIACRHMGVDPPVLPDDVVETLREIGDMMA